MSWDIDSWVIQKPRVIGITAVKVLDKEALRAGYRIVSARTNTGIIYHGYDGRVGAASPDYILPGGEVQDAGEWHSVHHGEVWLVASIADQTAIIEKVITQNKPSYYEKKKWWQW